MIAIRPPPNLVSSINAHLRQYGSVFPPNPTENLLNRQQLSRTFLGCLQIWHAGSISRIYFRWNPRWTTAGQSAKVASVITPNSIFTHFWFSLANAPLSKCGLRSLAFAKNSATAASSAWVNLRLIGKRVVDFLLVLIELSC